MRIPHHLLLSAGVVFLASCGGGGGGDDTPFAQPTSFLPEGVVKAELQFDGGSGLPTQVYLTQKSESTKSENATWTATVSSGVMTIKVSDMMSINVKLVGEVDVTRQAGDQGFLLTWRGQNTYAEGEAGLEGSMQLRYYNMDDSAGLRLASVTVSDIKLVYSNEGQEIEEDFTPGLDGSAVRVTFTPPKPQTPPATDNNASSAR